MILHQVKNSSLLFGKKNVIILFLEKPKFYRNSIKMLDLKTHEDIIENAY